jgi:hypothetical protein
MGNSTPLQDGSDVRSPTDGAQSIPNQLASAVEIAVATAPDTSDLDSQEGAAIPPLLAVWTGWPESAVAEDRLPLVSAPQEAEAVDATELPQAAPVFAGVSTPLSGDDPDSQAAVLVTLAILTWQAGCAYFLPAGRPGQVALRK